MTYREISRTLDAEPEGEPEMYDKRPQNHTKAKPRKDNIKTWKSREFIAWDGEGTAVEEPVQFRDWNAYYWPDRTPKPGEPQIFERKEPRKPQPYVLLANSKGGHLLREEGLGTIDCFEFLLETKKQFPTSIFVGFGLNYDVNQIMKDLHEEQLWRLHDTGRIFVGQYRVHWIPKKWLMVSHKPTKRSFKLYDVFGHFQTSFLQAAEKYLGKDDPDLALIRKGKEAREHFSFDELEEFILPYNAMELSMLVRMMDILRNDYANAGIYPSEWYGPGAIANLVLAQNSVPTARNTPQEVRHASQYAFAGGRFEQFKVGFDSDTVYEYDIHSAYPAGAIKIPNLTSGHWEHVRSFEPDTFGIWHIEYRSPRGESDNRPQPLFCRSRNGTISYPREVCGWYWTPEARFLPDCVIEGWVFRPSTHHRPFAFLEELYERRGIFQSQGLSTERAIKLILNSIYGKRAQTVGGSAGPPRWHQLEDAGFITSYTRAKIWDAICQNPGAIIAVETDAVFSTEPLDLPLSNKLGEWEEKTHEGIAYLQSGFYYSNGGLTCKYRGMDRDRNTGQPTGLPYNVVLEHLRSRTGRRIDGPTPALHSYTTRFVGLGLGLRTESVWRSWEKKNHVISLDQSYWQKRFHVPQRCPMCWQGKSMYDVMHPLEIGGYSGDSYARDLPWEALPEPGVDIDLDEFLEMDGDYRDLTDDYDRWQ